MKKHHFILLLSGTLLTLNIVKAQTVQIGNMTNGLTASGNTLSINSGGNSIQIGGVPPLLQGAVSATKEAIGSNDASKVNPENAAKLEAAKNNFIQQKEEILAKANSNNNVVNATENNKVEQQTVRVGQDLSTLKSTLVTNNIAFYNKTTINQIEGKAREENPRMYSKFPEYILKDY